MDSLSLSVFLVVNNTTIAIFLALVEKPVSLYTKILATISVLIFKKWQSQLMQMFKVGNNPSFNDDPIGICKSSKKHEKTLQQGHTTFKGTHFLERFLEIFFAFTTSVIIVWGNPRIVSNIFSCPWWNKF